MDPQANGRVNGDEVDADGADHTRLDHLFPLVYEELRDVAHRQLLHERSAATLSTTALVHEAYLRLATDARVAQHGRAYFFAAAAQAMRRIVIDYARRRQRLKRGGGVAAIALTESLTLMNTPDIDVLDLDRGLVRLAALAERPSRVVECRFFGGLSVEDTALVLGVTTRTVKRDWAFARAWLFDYLRHPSPVEAP